MDLPLAPTIWLVTAVTIILSTATISPAQNLLTDPGMEQGTQAPDPNPTSAPGWSLFNGGTFSTAFAHSGTQSLSTVTQNNVPGAYQQFAASPGQAWTMTGFGMAPTLLAGSPAFGDLEITFFDGTNGTGNNIGTLETSPGNSKTSAQINGTTASGVWTPLSVTAHAPAGARSMQAFCLYVDFSGDIQGVYFDDLTLQVQGVVTNNWTAGTGKWETGGNWSIGSAPFASDLADVITNATTKTVTIDATTTNTPSTLAINNLIVAAPLNMTNTLLLSGAGTNAPLIASNSVRVNSGGSMRLTNSALQVGSSSGGALTVDGQLTLDSGTILVSSNLLVGTSNTLGFVTIRGGALYVTNAAHNAVTEVRYGTLVLTGGVYFTDSLLTTNSQGHFINNGGTFTITGAAQVTQGTQTFTSGTAVLSSNLLVGSSANSTGTVLVTGGTLVVTNGVIGIGDDGSGTNGLGVGQMTVSNATVLANIIQLGSTAGGQGDLTILAGGAIDFGSAAAGTNAALVCNDLWLDGGLLSLTNGTLYCGTNHNGSMTMSNGIAFCYVMNIGLDYTGTMTMSGGAMTMMPNSRLDIGGASSTGMVWMTGGQILTNGAFTVSLGNNNIGMLTLSNGTVQATTVSVGNTGTASEGGTLNVAGGTLTIADNLKVGAAVAATGTVSVTAGQLLVSSGTITVGGKSLAKGQFTIAGGTVQANCLKVLTNGAPSGQLSGQFTFNSGTLSSGDAMTIGSNATVVTNSQVFIVGNGASGATFNLRGVNIHSFAKTLEVNANAALVGCGTINGSLLVDQGGTVLADCGGTLTFNGIVTNNGTMRALNGSTLAATGAVVNNGVINIMDGQTNFPGGFMNINNGIVVDGSFRITAIARESNDIRVFWTIVSNRSYVVQATSGSGAEGSLSNNFTDLSSTISIPPNPITGTTNYLDIGGGTNQPSRYYRVRLAP